MAVMAVLVAVTLRLVFMQSLGSRAVFVTFYPAVILSALYGGLRPGFLAALLSFLAIDLFWLEPHGMGIRDSADWLSLAVFLPGCAIIILIIEAMHRARRRAVAAETEAAGQAAERLLYTKELQRERDLLQSVKDDALAARHHAEQVSATLQQREAQLMIFVEHAPAAIAMLDKNMCYIAASRRWLADYGLNGQNILGRSHYEIFPEIPERWKAIHRRCLDGAVERAEEDPFDRTDGVRQWLRWEIHPWNSAPDTIGGIIIFSEDITERKRAEERIARLTKLYAVLSRVNEAIVRIHDENKLYGEVCRIVAEHGEFPLVWIGVVQSQQVIPVAWSGPASDCMKEVKVAADGLAGRGPTGAAIREGRAIVDVDIKTDSAMLAWRMIVQRFGFRDTAAFPLLQNGRIIGALTLHAKVPDAFDAEQVQLLEALCTDLSYALESMLRHRLHAEAEAALRETEKQASEDAIRLAWGQSAIDMINAMSEGVILQELDGTIISINPAVETMTGITGGAVIGHNVRSLLGDFLQDEDLIAAQNGLVSMRHGHLPRLPPVIVLRHTDKIVRVIPTVTFVNTPENGRRMALLTLKDVTQLYETERKYRELVENANSAIMRVTPGYTISFFNEYAQHLFGYTPDEVLGRHVVGTIVPEVDSEGRDMRLMVRTVIANPEQYASNENENMCKDGRRVWVHWANRAIRDTKGAVCEIMCIGTDITERKRIQAQNARYHERLRALADQLAASEEQKRWQISRYVHDTIVQNLSLSCMRLGGTQKALATAGLSREVDNLLVTRQLVNNAITECRTVMSDLTPALLYELGLVPALKDLGDTLQKQHGVRICVEEDGTSMAMAAPIRGMLFQSTRELIMNALKHAGPCTVHVDVTFAVGQILIRVQDDGVGFDTAKLDQHDSHQGGFGLFGVRQRLENLGGCLEIESAPGKGVTALIFLPLTDSRESV